MIIECSQCGDRKYIPKPVPYGKVYLCKKCRTVLILAKEEKVQAGEKRKNPIFAAQQAMLILIITVLLVSTLGTSVAAAKTGSKPTTPLEGIVAVLTGAPTDSTTLLDDVQSVVAQYERSVVSGSLQWMRIVENLPELPPVTVPTNDMALFPTPQNPLFPEYLNWKYSQFNYTVDQYGIVSVETDNLSGNVYH